MRKVCIRKSFIIGRTYVRKDRGDTMHMHGAMDLEELQQPELRAFLMWRVK